MKREVVKVPFTEGKVPGGSGWLFPKRSPFLPIFNKHFWELKELGHWKRISKSYSSTALLSTSQENEDLDEHPISMHKVISLFAMFFGAAFLSLLIFWYELSSSNIFIEYKSHKTFLLFLLFDL